MFIELTDHLRCPAAHDEGFLVLLPEVMEGRSVVRGQLGCPTCGRIFHVEQGELRVGDSPGATLSTAGPAVPLDASAIVALAGVHGPGGYFVLVGQPAGVWRDIAALTPGIGLVALNPETDVQDAPGVSILRGNMIPLKANSMRGVVLGAGYGGDPAWSREAARVTLPGLRIVGQGPEPPAESIELMASADGVWVGTKRR